MIRGLLFELRLLCLCLHKPQMFEAATATDGAIDARRLLAERDERPWILSKDGVPFVFRGKHALPKLWGQ